MLETLGAMGLQCFCFWCAGKVVGRSTFYRHGAHDRPPGARDRQPKEQAGFVSVENAEGLEQMSDSDEEELGLSEEPVHPDPGYYDPFDLTGEDGAGDGGEGLSGGSLTLLLLDWMSSGKVSDAAAHTVWDIVKALVPDGTDMRTFRSVKNILSRVEPRFVQRIEVCRNDCVAFWDSTSLPVPVKHSHRTSCPVCGARRYLTDPNDGAQRAAKAFYFFPLAPYVRGLFARADLVNFLYTDRYDPTEPPGSVRKSRGWKAKMVDNETMSTDHRNLALVETCDGVPFFREKKASRGCWPFTIRCANLPDGLSMHMANCHLHLLVASEYYDLDSAAGVLRRVVREPQSLVPYTTVIADDLRRCFYQGTVGTSRHIPSYSVIYRHIFFIP